MARKKLQNIFSSFVSKTTNLQTLKRVIYSMDNSYSGNIDEIETTGSWAIIAETSGTFPETYLQHDMCFIVAIIRHLTLFQYLFIRNEMYVRYRKRQSVGNLDWNPWSAWTKFSHVENKEE